MASRVLCPGCGRAAEDPGELAGFRCGHCGGGLLRVPVPKPEAFDRRVAGFLCGCVVGGAIGSAFDHVWPLVGAVVGALLGLAAGWREA